jgi:AGCS family alanine or glycine:cation symporter
MMGILEVFLDTIVICTLTALSILVSGVQIPYGMDAGGELTGLAFSRILGQWASAAIGAFLVLFAVATVLGWGVYGGTCAAFLFGPKAWKWFCMAQIPVILFSSVSDSASVWLLSETVNGLMAIPNLITLAIMTPEVIRLTKDYRKSDAVAVSGGTYADFHQRKPLRTLSYAEVPSAGGEGKGRW